MYADEISSAMKVAIDETNRRRTIQEEYNKKHDITPKTIIKDIREVIEYDGDIVVNEYNYFNLAVLYYIFMMRIISIT